MGVLHMPTAAGHHPLKSYPRHEAPPQIILKSVTFTMTTDSPSRAPPRVAWSRGLSNFQRERSSLREPIRLPRALPVSDSVAVPR